MASDTASSEHRNSGTAKGASGSRSIRAVRRRLSCGADLKFVCSVLLATMSIYVFTTITYQLYPIALPINRVWGLFVAIELILITLNTLKRVDVVFLCMLSASAILSFSHSGDPMQSFNDAVYWFVTSLMLWKIADKEVLAAMRLALGAHKKKIFLFSSFCVAVIGASFALPSSYDAGWGGDGAFVGLAGGSHMMASGTCLVFAFVLAGLKKKPFRASHLLLVLIPTIAILATGARIFLVPLAVIFFIYARGLVLSPTAKRALVACLFLAFLGIALGSNSVSKFSTMLSAYSIQGYTPIDYLTSGRTVFWVLDANAFFHFDALQKMIGHGFDFVYELNFQGFGMRIWAHNDYLDILLGAGIFGVAVYLAANLRIVSLVRRSLPGDGFLQMLFIAYAFVPAFFNGLFTYQHLLYSFIVLIIAYCRPREDENSLSKRSGRIGVSSKEGF
jgi:O-antigen ligase